MHRIVQPSPLVITAQTNFRIFTAISDYSHHSKKDIPYPFVVTLFSPPPNPTISR